MALKVLLINHQTWMQIPRILLNKFCVKNIRYLSLSSQKVTFPKYITLRHCPSSLQSEANHHKGTKTAAQEPRPLALIFSWMLSKDKGLEKYRELWFRRGFDVLTVRTSTLASLMPPIGSKVVAKNLLTIMSKLNHQYSEVVVQAFSMGCYQCVETFVEMRAQNEYLNVSNSIKGVIFDSAIFTDGLAPGISKVVTKNPIIRSMIVNTINLYLKLTHNYTMINYKKAEQELNLWFNNNHPGLMFNSKDDPLSSVQEMDILVKSWNKSGNKIRYKCWEKSGHILHYKNHRKEYEEELDAFLKSLNLRTNRLT